MPSDSSLGIGSPRRSTSTSSSAGGDGSPPLTRTRSWTADDLFDLFPNLAEARSRLGGTLSGGEQQMLTIARTLMGNPGCILQIESLLRARGSAIPVVHPVELLRPGPAER